MEQAVYQRSKNFYTVSGITEVIKSALDQSPSLSHVWLKGEISNFSYQQSSGHMYFKLKDNDAIISATFFKYANKSIKFKPKDGMSVFAFGSVTVYGKGGSYQFNVSAMTLDGMGELQQQIEDLKKKLAAEGLFAPERKQPLPFLPKRIGVVTSPTGAAVQDIIKVALGRYPNLEILVAPAKVQGSDAPQTIVRGIEELNKPKYEIDLIIAGRGGGSFEDLMAFNDELVIRAFAASRVPIISAVGHQVDHPLSDDAADAFAPTPSAAAELAVPVKAELLAEVNYLIQRAEIATANRLNVFSLRFRSIMQRHSLLFPMELVERRALAATDLENRIISALKETAALKRRQIMALQNLQVLIKKYITAKQHRFSIALQALSDRSPLNIIKRGYAAAKNEKGNIIKTVSDVKQNENIAVYVADGSLGCTVNLINKGDAIGKETKGGSPNI